MKVLILTSSLNGTAAHHLNYLIEEPSVEITMVIYNEGVTANKKKRYLSKLRKVIKIGFLGALNGIRIRKWYHQDLHKYIQTVDIEKTCSEMKIPFFKTPAINSETTLGLFKKANADVALSLGNGYIPKKIFSVPKYGMLNIHHEILPDYQNAQSIIWQLYNGSDETGYTIHKIDKQIDTGEILYQEKIKIGFRETLADTVAYTLSLVLRHSAEGLVKVLKNFDFYFSGAYPQGKGHSYTTPTFMQYLKMKRQFKRIKK